MDIKAVRQYVSGCLALWMVDESLYLLASHPLRAIFQIAGAVFLAVGLYEEFQLGQQVKGLKQEITILWKQWDDQRAEQSSGVAAS